MKIYNVIKKSFKEQIRQFWILVLTISMAPFFIFVYYLIIEGSKVSYDLLIVNQNTAVQHLSQTINHAELLIDLAEGMQKSGTDIPVKIKTVENRESGIRKLKNKKADAVVIIPTDFSARLQKMTESESENPLVIEFVGDLTDFNYIITAIWANDVLNEYIAKATRKSPPLKIRETALGSSARIDDFTYSVPGLLILSVIMLMFTATIALITEVENKTMLRLKLSKLTGLEFLAGISFVQMVIGIVAILLSLVVAIGLGFRYSGSLMPLVVVAVLTSISIIAFSMILAGVTKTVNEVLVLGNFPLFLFMFFTGVAFPIKGQTLFSILGYPVIARSYVALSCSNSTS
ncbi:ABC transporter permease [Calditrichota bacterium]